MKLTSVSWLGRLGHRLFNLNDPQWGRGADGNDGNAKNANGQGGQGGNGSDGGEQRSPRPQRPTRGPDQPPDLEELWGRINRRLADLFGGSGGKRPPGAPRPTGDGGGMPDMRGAGIGLGAILGIFGLLWLGTGFFIVQEGQQAVVLQFGRFKHTTDAGFKWRLPYPIQRHEIVNVSQLRSVEIGRGSIVKATGLKESSMLTMDENIIDVRFAVQYRVRDAQSYLFTNRAVDDTVTQAAETAVREIVGRSKMDTVLYAGREKVAEDLKTLAQRILDEYRTGIQIASVTIQNVQPPEQVQAAFDDAVKAGQDFERLKNEGLAYREDVIPKARGMATRLREEANGYAQRIVAQAEGDAERFKQIYTEYAKAPAVTRDRMYLETMQSVFNNVTKIMVDARQGGNLLYLPLDKIMSQSAGGDGAGGRSGSVSVNPPAGNVTTPESSPTPGLDLRSREALRNRDGSR
jgi:membrane protease subunit HflK